VRPVTDDFWSTHELVDGLYDSFDVTVSQVLLVPRHPVLALRRGPVFAQVGNLLEVLDRVVVVHDRDEALRIEREDRPCRVP